MNYYHPKAICHKLNTKRPTATICFVIVVLVSVFFFSRLFALLLSSFWSFAHGWPFGRLEFFSNFFFFFKYLSKCALNDGWWPNEQSHKSKRTKLTILGNSNKNHHGIWSGKYFYLCSVRWLVVLRNNCETFSVRTELNTVLVTNEVFIPKLSYWAWDNEKSIFGKRWIMQICAWFSRIQKGLIVI